MSEQPDKKTQAPSAQEPDETIREEVTQAEGSVLHAGMSAAEQTTKEIIDILGNCLTEVVEASGQELETLRARVAELEAENARLRAKAEHIDVINSLRANEGASVLVLCDNPDFSDPNVGVEVNDAWTNWIPMRFGGDNVLDALRKALAAREALSKKGGE